MTTDDLWDLFDEPIPDRSRDAKAKAIVAEYKSGKRQADPVATITCRVCGKKETRSIDVVALLCTECRSDIASTAMMVDRRLQAVMAQHDAALARWMDVQAQMDDITASRMARLTQARLQAQGAADRARKSKPAGMEMSRAVEIQQDAELRLSEIFRKIQRSREAGDALSAVILEEDRYYEICKETNREKMWCDIANQEIDAALSGSRPF